MCVVCAGGGRGRDEIARCSGGPYNAGSGTRASRRRRNRRASNTRRRARLPLRDVAALELGGRALHQRAPGMHFRATLGGHLTADAAETFFAVRTCTAVAATHMAGRRGRSRPPSCAEIGSAASGRRAPRPAAGRKSSSLPRDAVRLLMGPAAPAPATSDRPMASAPSFLAYAGWAAGRRASMPPT